MWRKKSFLGKITINVNETHKYALYRRDQSTAICRADIVAGNARRVFIVGLQPAGLSSDNDGSAYMAVRSAVTFDGSVILCANGNAKRRE